MRNFNKNVLSAADSLSTNGEQIDSGQLVSASFHAYFGDALAAGTFKLQASNDVCAYNNLASQFTVTNWVDIPNQSASISSGASALLTIPNMAYKWIRAVYTNTTFFALRVIQDLTYTADLPGSTQTAITIRYIGDGTAGAETVNVTGNAIVVHMDPTPVTGSSATQIKAAVDGNVPASALISISISGTGGNVQAVQAATPLSAAAGSSTININFNALGI